MRRMGFIALMFVLALEPLTAQSTDSLNFKGKKALVFLFNGFKITGGLGGKYWVNDRQFLRVTMTGNYSIQKTDRVLTSSSDRNIEFKRSELDLSLDFAHRFGTIEGFFPYGGARLGLFWYSNEQNDFDLNGTNVYHSINLERLFLGGAFLGVEYFVTPRIAFSGEQRLTVTFGRAYNYAKRFNIDNTSSWLMVSVYL